MGWDMLRVLCLELVVVDVVGENEGDGGVDAGLADV